MIAPLWTLLETGSLQSSLERRQIPNVHAPNGGSSADITAFTHSARFQQEPHRAPQSIRAKITVQDLNIFMTAALTAFPRIDIKEALALREMLRKVLGQLGKPLPSLPFSFNQHQDGAELIRISHRTETSTP